MQFGSMEENQFVMHWDDKRAQRNEVVTLLPKDKTDDPSDTDRWNDL